MRTPKSTAPNALRRWPDRNFLAEFEPTLRETNALDDLARQDPHLRRLKTRMARASKEVQRAVGRKVWIAFADSRLDLSLAEFDLAFNLGFENGLVAGKTLRQRHASGPDAARFSADLRRLIAGAAVPRQELLGALLELSSALATGGRVRALPVGRGRRTT
jgi:hypothetical protein